MTEEVDTSKEEKVLKISLSEKLMTERENYLKK